MHPKSIKQLEFSQEDCDRLWVHKDDEEWCVTWAEGFVSSSSSSSFPPVIIAVGFIHSFIKMRSFLKFYRHRVTHTQTRIFIYFEIKKLINNYFYLGATKCTHCGRRQKTERVRVYLIGRLYGMLFFIGISMTIIRLSERQFETRCFFPVVFLYLRPFAFLWKPTNIHQ